MWCVVPGGGSSVLFPSPIMQLQLTQSDMEQMKDMISLSNRHVHALCEHLDKILMHG